MDLHRSIHRLLKEIGPGRMESVAYDTAWVARLARLGEPIGEQALEWLREHQLPDGSWGAAEPVYYHDRLVSTLAAMIALARYGNERDRRCLYRARESLETISSRLGDDPAGETIGFEMIVPTLLAEAQDLGLISRSVDGRLELLSRYRAAKLAALPDGAINRFVTVAFSAEMAGYDGQHWLDVEHLQEANGSVGHSPSATAYFATYIRPGDLPSLRYLQNVVVDGGAPDVSPFDIFEQAWTLWNLALANSWDEKTLSLCQPHISFLRESWDPHQGVGFAAGYTPKDGDETSVVFEVLSRFGYSLDPEAVLRYEEDEYFRCYMLEANPSISTNVHALGALRQAGFSARHPAIQKILRFLRRTRTLQLFWLDKWHASPYYATSHAIIACAGYDDELVDDSVYWMIETQNPDGSWGYYMPTAEETAYCLQALAIQRRCGHRISPEVLRRGAVWLVEHMEPPYPPLWIGKGLYSPQWVVRSAILSALMLVAQESS